MGRKRTITLDIGLCKECQACTELAPDYVAWDENMDKPVLIQATMDEDKAQELIAYCPEDCFAYDDDLGDGE